MWLVWLIAGTLLLAGCQQSALVRQDPPKKKMVFTARVLDKTPAKKSIPPKLPPKKSSEPSKDGAPAGPLPVSFKKIVPISEPLSRYGNPAAYHVNGKTYEVMTSSSGYRARGLASWYGTKFHQKRTSSGEDYDLYELTAAHKTLPLPTYVRVKNLENGREAIVKVNDRGPFHKDRIIDLSYGAAVKLGVWPTGTARVEIEALTTHGPHAAHYYVQAGAFSSQSLAQALRGKLAKLTPSPVFIEKYQQFFVVKVGPFADKKMTEVLKKALAQHGVTGAFSLLQ
ncbi:MULTISPECIES: septal ring lytic transglycosylase RlpA family protein [Legionella]|nr:MULTISPECIES: septal ring lytic transglycosylase RlpA family protein [Legionella]MCP0913296.1 septal ring lytic transglycosylase RlpA family protein [Legionella sp. 27cVA30]